MSIYKLTKKRNEGGLQTDAKGKPMLFYRGASNRIACAQNEYGAVTGLTKEEEAFYEKELHLAAGRLDRNSDFWHDWHVKVDAAGKLFNDEEPKDRMDMTVLKQRAHVGYTLEDAKNPEIFYILTSEDHDAKVAIDSRTYKKKAFSYLDKMTPEDMRNYLIGTGRRVKGLSPEQIEDLVGADAELSPKHFLEVVEDEDKDLKVFINELLQYNIFSRDASAFKDNNTKATIGYRMESVIEHFKDVNHQPYFISLQKELTRAKKSK